jgi:hypothetical protein
LFAGRGRRNEVRWIKVWIKLWARDVDKDVDNVLVVRE